VGLIANNNNWSCNAVRSTPISAYTRSTTDRGCRPWSISASRAAPNWIDFISPSREIHDQYCRLRIPPIFRENTTVVQDCSGARKRRHDNIFSCNVVLQLAKKFVIRLITRFPWIQEAQLSPSDRAMCHVSRNLANYHATVQKLLVRQVLIKSKLWS